VSGATGGLLKLHLDFRCIVASNSKRREETTIEELLHRSFPVFMSSFKVFDELLTCYSSRLQGPELRLFRIKGVAVKLNGTMKKVHKSKMIEKLHTEPMEAVPEKYIALVDMGFLWRLATPSAEDREKPDGSVFTWGDYADKLFSIAVA